MTPPAADRPGTQAGENLIDARPSPRYQNFFEMEKNTLRPGCVQ